MVMGERLSSGADRVQGIALGPATPRRPLGPADLHHPLAAALQEGGQPSAVAASTLHRPTAPTRNLHLGEVQKATVAGRIRPYRGLGKQAAHRVGGGRGKGVAVGVDADHAVNGAGQPAHRHGSSLWFSVVGWSCRPGGHRAALL
jgi:hypothetical protein